MCDSSYTVFELAENLQGGFLLSCYLEPTTCLGPVAVSPCVSLCSPWAAVTFLPFLQEGKAQCFFVHSFSHSTHRVWGAALVSSLEALSSYISVICQRGEEPAESRSVASLFVEGRCLIVAFVKTVSLETH